MTAPWDREIGWHRPDVVHADRDTDKARMR